jgi:hypothetical protein
MVTNLNLWGGACHTASCVNQKMADANPRVADHADDQIPNARGRGARRNGNNPRPRPPRAPQNPADLGQLAGAAQIDPEPHPEDWAGEAARPRGAPPPYEAVSPRQQHNRADRGGHGGAHPQRRPNQQGHRRHQQAQAGDQRRQILEGVAQHDLNLMYNRAVLSGFPNVGALNRFNAFITANEHRIQLERVPVCTECGNATITLCTCFVNEAAPIAELQDRERPNAEPDVLAIGVVGTRNTFQQVGAFRAFVNGVQRFFMAPSFNFEQVNNHFLRGLSNADIGEDGVNQPLYCYIRMNMHAHYRVCGTEDRNLRLEHCRKLALLWLALKKYAFPEETRTTNWFIKTIQIACDQAENKLLYSEVDPNWGFYIAWGRLIKHLLCLLPVFLLALVGFPELLPTASAYVPVLFRPQTWKEVAIPIRLSHINGGFAVELIANGLEMLLSHGILEARPLVLPLSGEVQALVSITTFGAQMLCASLAVIWISIYRYRIVRAQRRPTL